MVLRKCLRPLVLLTTAMVGLLINSAAYAQIAAWSASITYSNAFTVNYSGSDYVSLQNGNHNENPATQPDWWGLIAATPYPVTGNIGGIAGASGDLIQLRFNLVNCGNANPIIAGSTAIAPAKKLFTATSAGTISGTLWGNDSITCGAAATTLYQATFLRNNVPAGVPVYYRITESFDLASAVPVYVTPPTIPLNAGITCPAGQALVGVLANFTPVCQFLSNGMIYAAGPPPASSCTGTAQGQYFQTDATPGRNWWACSQGTWIQQGAVGTITAAGMQTALNGQAGCTVAGNSWNPATNTCPTPPAEPTIATTLNVLKGDGAGNGVAATPGTDYATPSSGIANCPLQNTTNICLTQAPYYASGAGATTTTAASIPSGSTSATVSTCNTFNTQNGILIPGAGAAGADLIDRLTSCTGGNTLHWTTATSTTVSSVTIYHDELPAFQAARDAIAANQQNTGNIWLPEQANGSPAVYNLDGPLQDPSGANAVFPLPSIPSYSGPDVDIAIRGYNLPQEDGFNSAASINTRAMTGNLIGAHATGGAYNPLSNVKLTLSNIVFNGPCNTGIVFVNATNTLAAQAEHVAIRSLCSTTFTAGSGGIWMPAVGNEIQNYLQDVGVAGVDIDFKLTEHTVANKISAVYGGHCFTIDNGNISGSFGSYTGNGVEIVEAWEQNCVNVLVGGSGAGGFHNPVHVSLLNMENTSGNGILDPSNTLYGIVNILIPSSVGSTTPCNANQSGGTHLTIHYISCQPESSSNDVPPSNGLLENWNSQEGHGSTLVNTGLDLANSMTSTAVTWTTVAGFPSPVATYNGTTSTSVAASATNTAFDGSTPFSSCVWINPSSLSSFASGYILTNVSPTPSGFGLTLYGTTGPSGSIEFGMLSSGSNVISRHTTTNLLTVGQTSHVCATYDGTKLAAGVSIYVNGTLATSTVTSDTLAGGSIASSQTLTIGSARTVLVPIPAAIGGVQIFNRLLSATEVRALYNHGPGSY